MGEKEQYAAFKLMLEQQNLLFFIFVCVQFGLEGAQSLQLVCFFVLIDTLKKIFILLGLAVSCPSLGIAGRLLDDLGQNCERSHGHN